MMYVLLILGFLLLIKGADYFVDGASGIAKYYRIPPIIIGLTIVAFGTSAPEAAVSISAALKGSNGISLGNVLGSNIFNISVIIGITSFLSALSVQKQTIRKEIPFTLLGGVALLVLANDSILNGTKQMVISQSDGIILLLFFTVFLYYIVEAALNSKEPQDNFLPESHRESLKLGPNLVYTLGGMAGIIIGGELVVSSSVKIATSFGISQTIIGLTIVSIGTSLPELITSITAARKKNTDIAVGNIIGSNIFNVLFVLGISASIHSIVVEPKLIMELFINIILTVVLFIFSRTNNKIVRGEGAVFILFYVVYMGYLLATNL
ncbi:calcium/sodium antiporter [Fusibacter bizertensis]|uniref:Calcium/sodium antiporter n=1 Tax=Fusibacter bizertensis TaxID=1488331 RepID=A0ABT6NBK7_9FIRM|nr:calcium/sodium antiporter [Fusibacter bizertensis]MDH8677806.1 calcium/sodium antiporter [Fusibacter bizertensis]